MDHIWLLCLVAGSFVPKTDTQALGQMQLINSDAIYFEDNLPIISKSISYEIGQPSGDQPLAIIPNVAPLSLNRPHLTQKSANEKFELHDSTKASKVQQPIKRQNPIQIENNNAKIPFDEVARALTNFSLSLMRNIYQQRSANTVVSPYSVATLLSLLQQGATDTALDQISGALQINAQTSAAVYRANTQDIQSRNSRNILRAANNIFLTDTFNLNPQFRMKAQRDFGSDITPTSFQNPAGAAQFINDWVAKKTENKIDKLVTPESLHATTQMVLVNALYFKGLWEVPFRAQSTKPEEFHLSDSSTKTLPFMHTRRLLRGGRDADMDNKVVILPFERDEYTLMIILPSTLSNVDDCLRSLTASKLESYQNFRPIEMVLKIPKFTIRADTDLTPVLKMMGITKIFEQSSDLSGLGMYRFSSPQVSSAIHSAVLSIDEEGGSAAAATAFAAVALSNDQPSVVIKVDRPFIAVLWDRKTRLPLFMAKIEDPSS